MLAPERRWDQDRYGHGATAPILHRSHGLRGKSDWDRYSKYGQNSNVAKSKQDYAKDPHTSMLFGKFDFSIFSRSFTRSR